MPAIFTAIQATFSFPTRIHFGPGSLSQLGPYAKNFKRPMVVADPGVVAAGVAQQVLDALGHPDAILFQDVSPNPTEANVRAGVEAFRAGGCDLIIAVGGGSPIDAAKAIRLATTHTRPLLDYDDLTGGDRFITADMPAMVAIPTTAGTGSEVARSAVVTLETNNRKTVLFSPFLIPTLSICDPELTTGLPPRITAATGVDALSHNLEAYLSKGYHPMADAIALEGIRLVAKYLPRAVDDGYDMEARTQMMMASIMGAVAFQKGLGATHSLAHPLSSEAGVHHGTANAIMMPFVVEFNKEVVPERVKAVGEALDMNMPAAEALRALNLRVGLPTRLSQVGVKPEMIPAMVEKALVDGCHQSNPRTVTAEDFKTLYERAM